MGIPIDERIAMSEEEFQKTEEPVNDYAEIPDGKYQAIIEDIKLEESKVQHLLQLKFTFALKSQFQGRKKWMNLPMEGTAKQLQFTRNSFAKMGIELKTLSEYKLHVPALKGSYVEINLASKEIEGKVRQNTYVNKLIEVEEAAQEPDIPGTEGF